MEKTAITLGIIALLLSMQANAAGKRMEADGCALLASTVESAVLRAAGQASVRESARIGRRVQPDNGIRNAGVASCADTTRVTTTAFAAALSKIGMPVNWGPMPSDSGDYCFSHYLEQCYPRLRSGYSASSAKQLSFVHDSWKAVNISVRYFMPYGSAGNISSFTPGVLKLSMIGAVVSNVDSIN